MLHWKCAITIAVVAIVVATILAFAPVSAAISIGSKAPSFKVTTIEGKSMGLADLMGKPSVIVFWATWCPHCRNELPTIQKLYGDLGSKGVNFIGISLDTDTAAAKRLVNADKVAFPIAIVSPGCELARSYGITGIPTVFILDKDGIVKAMYAGEAGESTIRGELAKLGVK